MLYSRELFQSPDKSDERLGKVSLPQRASIIACLRNVSGACVRAREGVTVRSVV